MRFAIWAVVIKLYKNLQKRGDRKNTRKSCNTPFTGGWKYSRETTLMRASFSVVAATLFFSVPGQAIPT